MLYGLKYFEDFNIWDLYFMSIDGVTFCDNRGLTKCIMNRPGLIVELKTGSIH